MKKDKESGAIVVEATIALTTFVFALVMILGIVNIAYAQAKIGGALNSATKEISQYSYLYFKLGVDNLERKLGEGSEEYEQDAKDTMSGINTMIGAFADTEDSINNLSETDIESFGGDVEAIMNNIDASCEAVEDQSELISQLADKISEDPRGYAIGMGKMALSQLDEHVKVIFAQAMAKAFMKKNLKSYSDQDPRIFLNRLNVVDNLDGLSFKGSYLMPKGSNSIQLVCSYEVEVMKLLDLDFAFKIKQCAKTNAWGNGVSLVQSTSSNKKSIWDDPDTSARGAYIISKEKKTFPYCSDRGFHAYDSSKNEFVKITTANTDLQTYQQASGIKNKCSEAYRSMYSSVNAMDEQITVKDQSGKKQTINSDKNSRKYRVVLVVPDNYNASVVNQGIADFKSAYPGVEVEVRVGYGSPSKEESSDESQSE